MWISGMARGRSVYLSVAFTYRLNDAYDRALAAKGMGFRVVAEGRGVSLMFKEKMVHPLMLVAELREMYPDAATPNPNQAGEEPK